MSSIASTVAGSRSRVDDVLALIERTLPGSVRVEQLARELGLPQRRLSSQFRQETGLSVRAYVLWRRLRIAVTAVAEGATLTAAAYTAGFSDAAHLSRTFVRMFGVPPSSSVSGSDLSQPEPPG